MNFAQTRTNKQYPIILLSLSRLLRKVRHLVYFLPASLRVRTAQRTHSLQCFHITLQEPSKNVYVQLFAQKLKKNMFDLFMCFVLTYSLASTMIDIRPCYNKTIPIKILHYRFRSKLNHTIPLLLVRKEQTETYNLPIVKNKYFFDLTDVKSEWLNRSANRVNNKVFNYRHESGNHISGIVEGINSIRLRLTSFN